MGPARTRHAVDLYFPAVERSLRGGSAAGTVQAKAGQYSQQPQMVTPGQIERDGTLIFGRRLTMTSGLKGMEEALAAVLPANHPADLHRPAAIQHGCAPGARAAALDAFERGQGSQRSRSSGHAQLGKIIKTRRHFRTTTRRPS